MLGFLGVAAGFGGAMLARALNVYSMGTGLFGSMVSVTGDAHQAQIAQDIFRADVRHELSLLVREDMRDVYALMCETVSTQVTMGSICLGVCFGVFIEGYASGAQAVILELWAMFVSWATLFTLTSLLLAMWFQMSIKNAVRERLLLRHRIFTPNDAVISSLGGRSLAEQVSRLHARVVSQLVNLVSLAMMPSSDKDEENDASAGRIRAQTGAISEAGPFSPLSAKGGKLSLKVPDLEARNEPIPENINPGELSWHELAGGGLSSDLQPEVNVTLNPPDCSECERGAGLSGLHIVRARRNLCAWYDRESHQLVGHKIVEIPGFLVGGALVRQPWRVEDFGPTSLEPLRLLVRSEATLYVAARVQSFEAEKSSPEPNVSSNPSWIQALDLNRVCKEWAKDEMPDVTRGAHVECPWFQRVEGFSIFVDSHRVHLPLYKLVLAPPEEDDEPVEVEVRWKFTGRVEALTIILREGLVLSSEDEYPKKAFLQEIEVLRPLMVFAARYIQCGTSCLLFAVLWMHLSRILPVRPWPKCWGEVSALLSAASVAFVGIWTRVPIDHGGRLFELQEDREGLGRSQRPNYSRTACLWGQRGGGRSCPEDDADRTPASRRSIRTSRLSEVVSSKLWHKSRRTNLILVACSCGLAVLFFSSLLWCLIAALDTGLSSGSIGPSSSGAGLGSEPQRPWLAWPADWPPLLAPMAAAFDTDGRTLWFASTFQLSALRIAADDSPAVRVGVPLRLPSSITGLTLVGDHLVIASRSGQMRTLDPSAVLAAATTSVAGSSWLLAAGLSALAAPTIGEAMELPRDLHGGAILAGAPQALAATPTLQSREGLASHDAGSIVLYEASGLGIVGGPDPKLEPQGWLRPILPAEAEGGSAPSAVRAIHLCVSGPCAAVEPRLFAARSGGQGSLLAVGLESGEVLELPSPWASLDDRQIVALTGNATHLLAISEAIV
eukprot:CAMPEP_0115383470 /NCGR_PEP_ID=MMETSP0271-20121206/6612_1 /TAXON_ID=71861 /ORGANISM="Scrippsiella trochoidea, Strain CCMP3099" /LENGTH=950 /DNA_ID=CAMNT_0002806801 /DNA_START=44 /DNA_END=2893 /DNA_ORIENTATION=+